MSTETYENLMRVKLKRKRQAAIRGDWEAVASASQEIIQLEHEHEEKQEEKQPA